MRRDDGPARRGVGKIIDVVGIAITAAGGGVGLATYLWRLAARGHRERTLTA